MYMYLLYYCVTGISVEVILKFSVCKLKRNCRQIAYTCRGWYVLHNVAVTDDYLPSYSFYNSVTKILVAVRLGFRLPLYDVVYIVCAGLAPLSFVTTNRTGRQWWNTTFLPSSRAAEHRIPGQGTQYQGTVQTESDRGSS